MVVFLFALSGERFGKPSRFSELIPQAEFISVEENRQFQACAGTDLFILLFYNSKCHFELAAQPLILLSWKQLRRRMC